MEYIGAKKGWYLAPSIVDAGEDGQRQNDKEEVVYVLHAPEVGKLKIGRTDNIKRRLSELRTSSPVELRLVRTLTIESGHSERSLHARYAHVRLHGEWFSDEILDDLLAL